MKSTLRTVAALLTSLLLWEILVRIFIARPVPFQSNAQLGWMPRPNSSALLTSEGYGVSHYNELGFRDSEIKTLLPGQMRILCLGDSFTTGEQMDASHIFTVRLQDMLRAHYPSIPLRVFNAGRSGTTPLYAVALAQQYKEIFQPDWVVLTVHDPNWPGLFDTSQEYYYRQEKKGLHIIKDLKAQRRGRLEQLVTTLHMHDSALYYYGRTHLSELLSAVTPDAPAVENARSNAQEISANSNLVPNEQLKALDATISRLRAAYSKLLVVNIPNSSAEEGGFSPPSRFEEQIQKSCHHYNVLFLNTRKAMVSYYSQTKQPPFGFDNTLPWAGHPNQNGHEIIALTLFNELHKRIEEDVNNTPQK